MATLMYMYTSPGFTPPSLTWRPLQSYISKGMHGDVPEINGFYVDDNVFTNFLIWIDGIFFIFLTKQSRSARPRPIRHD